MADKSRIALDLMRSDESVSWVSDQVAASFAEGIAQSAKDRGLVDPVSQFQLAEAEVTQRERTKREKYETSRPYEEPEKIQLIVHALHEVFVTIPAIQLAASGSLLELGAKAALIEFSAPDDEDNIERTSDHSVRMDTVTAGDLRQRYETFKEKLAS